VSFEAAWLDLREPADRAARDRRLLRAAAAWLSGVSEPVALDLGAGTGAMARAMEAVAGRGVRWRLVDNDRALLAVAAARVSGAEARPMDLADVAALPLDGVRLVTASALLDLASAAWIDALADRLASARVAVLATLGYDGTLGWEPFHEGDAAVRQAFNRHQCRDKGLGAALGPDGMATFGEALRRRGFVVRLAASPWRLGPDDAPLRVALVEGIAAAAAEMGCAAAAGWAQARRAARRSTVGHTDLFAVPLASAQSKTTSLSRP
jgi:SAM-dependent methyltransferase